MIRTLAIVSLLISCAFAVVPFSWSKCDSGVAINVTNLDLPSPIEFPKLINVTLQGNAVRDIKGQIKVITTLRRIVFGQSLPITCIHISDKLQIGTCTYDDACKDFLQDFAGLSNETCPFETIPAGTFIDDRLTVQTPDLGGSAFLGTGDYSLNIVATSNDSNTGTVLCLDMKFSIKGAN